MNQICVSRKNAIMAILIVAHAQRKPKLDSGERRKPEKARTRLPNFSQAFLGGRCSGSFLSWYASPMYTVTLLLSKAAAIVSSSWLESWDLKIAATHFLNRRLPGVINCFFAVAWSFSSANLTKPRMARLTEWSRYTM